MHNKNSTRYVESSCTEIHLHAWKKITMGLGEEGARAPSAPPPSGSASECSWVYRIVK